MIGDGALGFEREICCLNGNSRSGGLPLVDQFDERDPLHGIAVMAVRDRCAPLQTVALSEPTPRVPQRARSRSRRRSCPTLRGRRRSATRRSSHIKGISSSSAVWLPPTCRPSQRPAASRLPQQACPVGRRQRRPSSPSRRGRAMTSPSRQSISNAAARATANISGHKSRRRMPGTTNPLF